MAVKDLLNIVEVYNKYISNRNKHVVTTSNVVTKK